MDMEKQTRQINETFAFAILQWQQLKLVKRCRKCDELLVFNEWRTLITTLIAQVCLG